MIIKVKVLPRSSRNEVVGKMDDGTLKIKLTSPPVDGKANEALVEILSDHFDVPKSSVLIKRGETSKLKTIEILGI